MGPHRAILLTDAAECPPTAGSRRRAMKARDIMVKPVLSVTPATTVPELARLLSERRISGVPVVDDEGALVGIVSESDLLHRAEVGTEKRRKWWMQLFADSDTLARDFVKTHGTKVADIMSPYVVTVAADADLRQVADVLDTNEIKRVPVTEAGRLVGIITRGDLVRALVASQLQSLPDNSDDVALQKRIMERIEKEAWLNQTYISVAVQDGKIELSGLVASEAQHKALRILVEEAGGRTVVDNVKVGPFRPYAA
jgi:CBS-domain-containing membrane protein